MKTLFLLNLVYCCLLPLAACHSSPSSTAKRHSGGDSSGNDSPRSSVLPAARNDIFLVKRANGYDTLKNYLPNKDTTGRKFGGGYYTTYRNDGNEMAVNLRQIINLSSGSNDDKKH